METETKRNDGRTDKRTTANGRTVQCDDCGDRLPECRATSLDVSAKGEPRPDLIWFCPEHSPLVSEVAQ